MTAGAKTSCRPARTALISSMAARMALDIAPRPIFGKPEMADLQALKADGEFAAAALTACFNGLLTAFREWPGTGDLRNPALSTAPHNGTVIKTGGVTAMKSFIVLTAVAVLTIGNAIAAMPGAAGSMRTISADQPIVTMAQQELPFDRYWSKD
jgi:hypothetical protein